MTWTSLHEACQAENLEAVVSRTQSHSEEAFHMDHHGNTPLHVACNHPNAPLVMIQALLRAHPQAVADQDVHGDTPLHVALAHNPPASVQVIQVLLQASPTVVSLANREGLLPLHKLCRHNPNQPDLMEVLLEAYPYAALNPIKMGSPAPRKSKSLQQTEQGHHFVLGTSPTSTLESSRLAMKWQEGRIQVRDGAYPLHMLVGHRHEEQEEEAVISHEAVEMLIHAAPHVLSRTNKFGETPLHVALGSHCPANIVEILLCDPADLHCSEHNGEVSYHTDEMLCACAALLVQDRKHGNLPLHVAALRGCGVAVALLLVALKPETLQVKNDEGFTPYELAVLCGKCPSDVLRVWKV